MAERSVTEEDARRALAEHAVEKARLAREKYGDRLEASVLEELLRDPSVVRRPTSLRFSEEGLSGDAFGRAGPDPSDPGADWILTLHPFYRDHPDAQLPLALYQVVTINYGEMAGPDTAELFGATLLGLDREEYYRLVCQWADARQPPRTRGG